MYPNGERRHGESDCLCWDCDSLDPDLQASSSGSVDCLSSQQIGPQGERAMSRGAGRVSVLSREELVALAEDAFSPAKWSLEEREPKQVTVSPLRSESEHALGYKALAEVVVRVTVHEPGGVVYSREARGHGIVEKPTEYGAVVTAVKYASWDGLKRALDMFGVVHRELRPRSVKQRVDGWRDGRNMSGTTRRSKEPWKQRDLRSMLASADNWDKMRRTDTGSETPSYDVLSESCVLDVKSEPGSSVGPDLYGSV